jgi:hypothetical protein
VCHSPPMDRTRATIPSSLLVYEYLKHIYVLTAKLGTNFKYSNSIIGPYFCHPSSVFFVIRCQVYFIRHLKFSKTNSSLNRGQLFP